MSLAIVVTLCAAPMVNSESLPWNTFPTRVGEALHAFRQTEHWIAEATRFNMDGNELGRESEEGFRPHNFNPASHLSWMVADLNRDN